MSSREYKTIIEAIEARMDHFFAMHINYPPESGLHERVMREVEKIIITKTMQYSHSIQTKAARILGINRNTLRKKIKDLQIKL